MTTLNPTPSFSALSPKWQERFAFFDQYGPLSSPAAREAFKALPRKKKGLININLFGFFFGAIYFLILGLWKKALAILGLAFATGCILGIFVAIFRIEIPDFVFDVIGIITNGIFALSANYAYYQKTVHNRQSWNPFEGLRF